MAEVITLPNLAVQLTPDVQVQQVLAYEEVVEPVAQYDSSVVGSRVREYFSDIPIMVRVAWCESEFSQTDPRTGTVRRGVVNPKDVGVMQINEYYHAAQAHKLGIDIYSLEGNLEYARYLYEREGTRPWNASRACWESHALAMR